MTIELYRFLKGSNALSVACRRGYSVVRAIAEPLAGSPSPNGNLKPQSGPVVIAIDNDADPHRTLISIEGDSRPGLLSALAGAFRSLALEVEKATIDGSDGRVHDTFYVKQSNGGKVVDEGTITNVKRTLEVRAMGPVTLSCVWGLP